ncbi:MAG: tryptophan synthase subunit alpha [Candidatus Margulisiibacteriota bacterium]
MSRISDSFSKRKALITFITAGDPTLSVTERLIYDLERAGADIVELGIPFSDPLADGPIIQAAHARALKNNVSLKDVFALVGKVRKKTKIPLVFMLSQNLVEKYGPDKFYADCEKYGVDGVIVPDLTPDEKIEKGVGIGEGLGTGVGKEVDKIFLIAPTSSDERIKMIAKASTGFIYLVSATGITGKRTKSSNLIADMVLRIKKYSNKPVAVGFGISNPAQAREAVRSADGVIVGSAIVELIAKKQYAKVAKFVSALRKAIDA